MENCCPLSNSSNSLPSIYRFIPIMQKVYAYPFLFSGKETQA